MADYVKINPNSKNGDLMISRDVFEQLASEATNRVLETSKKAFRLTKPVQATFQRNGRIKITISIKLGKDVNANEICLKIQEKVSSFLMAYAESVPFEVQVNIVEIN